MLPLSSGVPCPLCSNVCMSDSTEISLSFQNASLYKHGGDHVAHSDLEEILTIPNWQLHAGQAWGLIGGTEQQRSRLLDALCEKIRAQRPCASLAEVSMAEQERLISAEKLRNQSGVADEVYTGTPVLEMLATQKQDARFAAFVKQLGFDTCLEKNFRDLSSGETRRLLLLRALLGNAEIVVLHDPLEGLDRETRPLALALLEQGLQPAIATSSEPTNTASSHNRVKAAPNLVVFAASRAEQLPAHCTHLATIENGGLAQITLDNKNSLAHALARWQAAQRIDAFVVPALPADHPFHQQQLADPAAALVTMKNVCVHYASTDTTIIDKLNWAVMPGQHWRIAGVNGSGKTTVLKLITGDHPQVYNNDISVCGFQRGSGESVWQIKRHIGYMGGDMLWNYRGTSHAGKALDVVISGLYDSIGLYTTPNAADRSAAEQWLALIGIRSTRQRFRQLGMAEQRLVLIARAMIKRPALLILDEPLQGLDGPDRQRVLAIIEALVRANAVTLLYVSHHDDEQVAGIDNTLAL
ncbi:MAG: ATP-binding cassette domain-containing protein [Pseudomonadales bacterium]|nr:MAG: ATP-binding cassette domain-containing protein [Pseudomonadales bacterium]